MAKITIAGRSVIVTSSMALEDIKTIKKYKPEALVLKGGEDGKEPIFALNVGGNSINSYGASFSDATRDEAKLATLTMGMNFADDVDVEEYVADILGAAITNLNKLEETLPTILEQVKSEREAVRANITVIQ